MKSVKYILSGAVGIIIVVLLVTLPFSRVSAYSDGPKNPAIGSNVTGVGTEPWVTPENITTPGTPYATTTILHNRLYSNYLQGTQYGFAVPNGSTISGIEVKINRMMSGQMNVIDNVVRLVKAGVLVGNNKASTLPWPTAFGIATYGGPTDLWGTTWTPDDINNLNFGAALAAYRDNNGSPSSSLSVDSMQITVYYGFTTTTTVACGSGTPITYGDNIVCTATISGTVNIQTPTGTVNWTSDSNGTFSPNPCTLSGSNGVSTCSATYTPHSVGSGTHHVTATYSSDLFFVSSSGSQAVTVQVRPVTVTADPQTKVFGAVDPEFTYQITEGSVVFTDTFTGSLTRDPGENVGTYAILIGSLALPASYDMTYVGANFTITKADPTCVITGYDVPFDGTQHTATGSCTGVAGAVLAGLNLSTTTHTNAGSYTDPWNYIDQTGNYNNLSGSVTDLISKANATCNVVAYNLEYDKLAHTAGGSCTGVQNETLTGLDVTGTSHTEIGTYNNDPWSFIDLTGNYNNTAGTVNDAITTRAITIVADAKTKLVGHPDPEFTYKITVGSLLAEDAVTGTLTRQPGEVSGTYAILQGTLTLPSYYTVTYQGANLTIIGNQVFLSWISR